GRGGPGGRRRRGRRGGASGPMSGPSPGGHGSPVLRAVADALAAPPAVAAGEHLLVAVSGGPDSTALLLAIAALAPAHGWQVTVAHVDHGLRGPEGIADRATVARLAAEFGLPLVERRLALARRTGLEV